MDEDVNYVIINSVGLLPTKTPRRSPLVLGSGTLSDTLRYMSFPSYIIIIIIIIVGMTPHTPRFVQLP